MDSDSFECAVCGKIFNQRKIIHAHIKQSHGVSECECAICQKKFKNRYLLQKHVRIHGEKKFECNRCGYKFQFKYQLTRHLPSHNTSTTKYECAICEKKLKNRNSLLEHIRSHGEKKFKCICCGYKFQFKRQLTRHLSSHNKKYKEYNNCYKCGFCFSCFRSKKEIVRHFENNHNITMRYKQLHFSSKEDFKKFKLDYQRKSTTQFIVQHSWKRLDGTTILYKCHRSGLYKAKEDVEKFPKISNLKKIQSFCPAEMFVKFFEDGKCFVNLQEKHVGHDIDDPNELCYIHLDASEKEEIAMQYGVPKNKIRNKQVVMFQEEIGLGLLCNQDIYNIASSFGTQSEYTFPFNDDMLNVNAFVEMHGTSVLYYKKQLEEDTKFYALANNDFALVFMNEFQEQNLRRYGENIIAFDSIQDTNQYGFLLHSLLIMNINYEGLPVAFILTNRNDVIIINIFLQCIKERVGTLTPRVILTDMQPTYENSWLEIMQNVPDFILWCTWHVREGWEKNYCKITGKKKREEVKKMVLDLACELNPVLFHCKLDTFLSIDDVDLEPFIAYFRRYYVENEKSQMWACCYRKDVHINTNMSLESFHRCLKDKDGQENKIDWLSCTLHCIVQYLNIKKMTEESGIQVRTNKMRVLHNRHHLARKKYKKEDIISKIHVINSGSWLVESFEKPNIMYVVEKKIVKECVQYDVDCGLYCHLCKFCFHEYSCNCLDAVIRNNMCKHIHAVGILENKAKTHTQDKLTLTHELEQVGEIVQLRENPMVEKKEQDPLYMIENEFSHELGQVGEIVQLGENPIENPMVEKKEQDPLNMIENEFSYELEQVGEIVQLGENPIENPMVVKNEQDPLNMIENEFSYELGQVGETIQLQENQIENTKVVKKRQDIMNTLIDVLKKTSNLKVLSVIEKRFVQPILPMIDAFQPKSFSKKKISTDQKSKIKQKRVFKALSKK